MSNLIIKNNTKTTRALNAQKEIGQMGFPFTLNPVIGCPFGCSYCFSRMSLWKTAKEFFENIEVKVNLPALLDKELTKLSVLPQHLKRVQINEACDVYHPAVLKFMKNNGQDIMLQILEVFKKHWDIGNKWMLHILTKSHLVTRHLNIYMQMKHMVQIEISISSRDEQFIRSVEAYTPTIKKRLETIEKLSKADIFVRVMAMPFYGDQAEMIALKNEAFQRGARAFKNKEINYFRWDDVKALSFADVLNEQLKRTGTKKDVHDDTLIIKSGELLLQNGKPQIVHLEMPKAKVRGEKFQDWSVVSKLSERLEVKDAPVIDSGYSIINNENWGYIK